MKYSALLALFIVFSGFCHADNLVMTESAWPPFIAPEEKHQGQSIALVKAALARAGHSSEFKELPWKRAIRSVKTDKYDILPAVWYSKERSEYFFFSDAYALNRMVFVKRMHDDFEFKGLSSLDDKTIGLMQAYAYGDEFLAYQGYQKSFTPSFIQNVKMLVLGRIELTLVEEKVGKAVLKNEAPELLDKVEFVQNSFSEIPLHIACAKVNPKCEQIIEDFNRELKAMKADGSYQKIMAF